jgi:hypothetical protein
VKHPGQPGKILLEEVTRSRVLMRRRNGMDADGTSAQGVVAARTAPNSNNTEGSASESDAANRSASDGKQDAHSTAPNRNDTNGPAPNGEQTTREPSASEPTRRNIAQSEDASGMSAHLATLQIWTHRNSPQWQATECA